MATHFELLPRQFWHLKAVVRSYVWAGNEYLTGFLLQKIYYLAGKGFKDPSLTEFCDNFIDSQQTPVPNISRQSLQSLVYSRFWVNEPKIISFMFENYLKLSKADQTNFGSSDFWTEILGSDFDDVQLGGGCPTADYYEMGEESCLRVKRFNAEAIGYNI